MAQILTFWQFDACLLAGLVMFGISWSRLPISGLIALMGFGTLGVASIVLFSGHSILASDILLLATSTLVAFFGSARVISYWRRFG